MKHDPPGGHSYWLDWGPNRQLWSNTVWGGFHFDWGSTAHLRTHVSTWQATTGRAQMGLSAFTCQTSTQVSNTDTADYTRRYCCDKNERKEKKTVAWRRFNFRPRDFPLQYCLCIFEPLRLETRKKKKRTWQVYFPIGSQINGDYSHVMDRCFSESQTMNHRLIH